MNTLPPRVAAVVRLTAFEHCLTVDAILGRRRTAPIVAARHKAMRRVRAFIPRPSFPMIGRWFDRDHSTVVQACQR